MGTGGRVINSILPYCPNTTTDVVAATADQACSLHLAALSTSRRRPRLPQTIHPRACPLSTPVTKLVHLTELFDDAAIWRIQ